MIAKVILLGICLAMSSARGLEHIDAHTAFTRLRGLVGSWEGKTAAGRVLKVSYRLAANDTVLVETWTLAPQRETLTLYHMDNESLVATHYCSLGNQPRLEFRAPGNPGRFIFEFVAATNLPTTETAHQDRFEIELFDEGSFARSETYLENGKAETERVVYRRIGSPSAAPD